jgi:hypothetical protein
VKITASLALVALIAVAGAPANAGDALAAADAAYAKVNDYVATATVHEILGTAVEDRVYRYSYLRPTHVRVDILSGPGRGGGAVWNGGDTVSGHQGGFLSGIHLTISIHDKRATSLRGDTIDTGVLGAYLDQFKTVKGQITEKDDTTLEGAQVDEVSLQPSDPTSIDGITRIDLYLSKTTHLPVERRRFIGTQLIKSEKITDLKIDTGLTPDNF